MNFYNRGALDVVNKDLKDLAVELISNYSESNSLNAKSPQVLKYINYAKQLKKELVQKYKEKYEKQNLVLVDAINQTFYKWVQKREGKTMPRKFVDGYIGAAKYTFDRASYKLFRADLEETHKKY